MSLIETVRAAPPRRQLLILVLGGAMVLALLLTVYVLVLRKPYDVLFNNLRTMDAATIIAELDKKKIPYRLKDHGATVLVPSNLVDATRLNVMSADLPLKGMVGFELFNKSDMGLTEFAQKINYQRALQGELARTIMTMDAVDSARIHLSIPEPTIFREDRRPPKASVTIITRPGMQLSDGTVRGVQRLIAAAVPDLEVANVVILDGHGQVVSPDAAASSPASSAEQQQEAVEQYYAAKVKQALDRTYPNSGIEVSVSAEARDVGDPEFGAREGALPEARRELGAGGYRLIVNVSVMAPLSPEAQDDVRNITRTSIGLDPAFGDVVIVSPSAGTWTGEQGEPVARSAPEGQPAPARPGKIAALPTTSSWSWAFGVLLAALLGTALVLHGRRNRPRGLTARERDAYVRRLKALIEERQADAAQRL